MNLKVFYSSLTDIYAQTSACIYFCLTRDTISLDRLLIQIRKKRGPEIDPCGTTEKIFIKLRDVLYSLYLSLLMAEVYILPRI